jgi:hypothetical protein
MMVIVSIKNEREHMNGNESRAACHSIDAVRHVKKPERLGLGCHSFMIIDMQNGDK